MESFMMMKPPITTNKLKTEGQCETAVEEEDIIAKSKERCTIMVKDDNQQTSDDLETQYKCKLNTITLQEEMKDELCHKSTPTDKINVSSRQAYNEASLPFQSVSAFIEPECSPHEFECDMLNEENIVRIKKSEVRKMSEESDTFEKKSKRKPKLNKRIPDRQKSDLEKYFNDTVKEIRECYLCELQTANENLCVSSVAEESDSYKKKHKRNPKLNGEKPKLNKTISDKQKSALEKYFLDTVKEMREYYLCELQTTDDKLFECVGSVAEEPDTYGEKDQRKPKLNGGKSKLKKRIPDKQKSTSETYSNDTEKKITEHYPYELHTADESFESLGSLAEESDTFKKRYKRESKLNGEKLKVNEGKSVKQTSPSETDSNDTVKKMREYFSCELHTTDDDSFQRLGSSTEDSDTVEKEDKRESKLNKESGAAQKSSSETYLPCIKTLFEPPNSNSFSCNCSNNDVNEMRENSSEQLPAGVDDILESSETSSVVSDLSETEMEDDLNAIKMRRKNNHEKNHIHQESGLEDKNAQIDVIQILFKAFLLYTGIRILFNIFLLIYFRSVS